MNDKSVVDRLQPSLLDRLTDDEPGSLKETRDSRVIDVPRLRDIIQRDLDWLLNTNNMQDVYDVSKLPRVAKSVLNYGVSPTAGDYSTSEQAERIRKSIGRAIETYEPRIVKGSIHVELRHEKSAGEMHVAFDIRADMWAQPMPLELYLRSRVDLTTGEVSMERSY